MKRLLKRTAPIFNHRELRDAESFESKSGSGRILDVRLLHLREW